MRRLLIRSLAMHTWVNLAARKYLCIEHSRIKLENYQIIKVFVNEFGRSEATCIEDLSNIARKIEDCIKRDEKCKSIYRKDFPPIPNRMYTWFRGQGNIHWDLIPTAHRNNQGFYLESTLIKDYLHHQNGNREKFLLETLSKMQHYSYPTRLLDWTQNIMVSAYFACRRRWSNLDFRAI